MNSVSDILKDSHDDIDISMDSFIDDVPTPPTPPTPPAPSSLDTGALTSMIHSMKNQLDSMLRLLQGEQVILRSVAEPDTLHAATGERIVEGVFDGEKMIGSDGKEYAIPANYASKSKLVEGDLMKLTITNAGSFLFKQIGPIERKRIVGELVCAPGGSQWTVFAEGRPFKILTASVTFYKGKAGDECVILVPENGESNWGAVENIITRKPDY